ncbi:MAG: aldo/keto reductase, partial [Anaerolineae bacterium]|nr:aldo/keto reductase [Anaerolineae bacterium]
DGGVYYLDTAWDYHEGSAEALVGKALKDGYRDRVKLVTKLPVWLVRGPQDFDRLLNAQLARLGVEHVDLYLLHALNAATWRTTTSFGVLDWLRRAQADGRIGWLGFSFHDEYPIFQQIVDAWDEWTVCQIQYNILDERRQAGIRGLRYAAARGLAVSIMEPLRGGSLVNPPQSIRRLWDSAPVKRTPAEWALQWLWNQPEVSVVLSGMNTLAQVDENLASADRSGAGILTVAELELAARVAREHPQPPIPCTRCHYCMPCPNGVNIPVNLALYNRLALSGALADCRSEYAQMPSAQRAAECILCQVCESVCPQKIRVSEWMERIEAELG